MNWYGLGGIGVVLLSAVLVIAGIYFFWYPVIDGIVSLVSISHN